MQWEREKFRFNLESKYLSHCILIYKEILIININKLYIINIYKGIHKNWDKNNMR